MAPSETPIVTFHVQVTSEASPDEVYAVLADPSTHLEWSGTEAPREDFKLLTLDAPSGLASKGTTFTSTGAHSKKRTTVFEDTSVVTEALPGRRFSFETDSHLGRKYRPDWHAKFRHTYELKKNGTATVIDYTGEVFPQNYRPYWLHPFVRPMTRTMVQRFMVAPLENLAKASERVRHS
jgi:hypothetical protein